MSQLVPPIDIWRHAMAGIMPTSAEWPEQVLHFTKLPTFREIAVGGDIALFNSLQMSDSHEVGYNLRFLRYHLSPVGALHNSLQVLASSLGNNFLAQFLGIFDTLHVKDRVGSYLFCVSEHDPTHHPEGRLSMWRAYGGDGAGVALGFQLALVKGAWNQPQPLIFYKVRYQSEQLFLQTLATILSALNGLTASIVPIWRTAPDVVLDRLYEIMLIAAYTRKHDGFEEEAEWRVIKSASFGGAAPYLRADTFNVGGSVRLGYRLSLVQFLQHVHPGATLDQLVGDVVIGPCDQQVATRQAVEHLLIHLGIKNVSQRVKLCRTPYRPNK